VSARYLVRFDDLNPAMRWSTWDAVEAILDDARVRPLVAVIPDNRDRSLELEPRRDDFWERVRSWQARGWAIGMHGYQHAYVTEEKGLVGRRAKSEFAGLSEDGQRAKVHAAAEIFHENGVRADAWVAPGHTFDAVTLSVLLELGIDVVSDGFAIWPHRDRAGAMWVPQQLWWFRRRPFGVWTVCLHHNRWTTTDVDRFRRAIDANRDRITDLASTTAHFAGRRRRWTDAATEVLVRGEVRARDLVSGLRG
jgi:predicted deacetylase